VITTRYAIAEDGTPIQEVTTWIHTPGDERAVPVPFHKEEMHGPENSWLMTSIVTTGAMSLHDRGEPIPLADGNSIYPAGSPFWNPLGESLLPGMRSITREEYDEIMSGHGPEARDDHIRAGVPEAERKVVAAWDEKVERYSRLGWSEEDCVAEFGPRPTVTGETKDRVD
jgi:hypothetical protein